MIDWATIKKTAHDVIAGVMHLEPGQVRWRDEAEGGTWMRSPTLLLSIFAPSDVGYAEERRTHANDTDDAQVVVSQQKSFTLSVRAESFTQKIDEPNHGAALLETLKTRLQRSTSISRLAGIFAITSFDKTRPFDYVDESNRKVSAHVMDLMCATVDNDLDTSEGAGGWIREVRGSGTIKETGPGNPPADTTINLDVTGG